MFFFPLLHHQQSLNSKGDLSKMLRYRSGTIYLQNIFLNKQNFHCRTSQSLEHADMNHEKKHKGHSPSSHINQPSFETRWKMLL